MLWVEDKSCLPAFEEWNWQQIGVGFWDHFCCFKQEKQDGIYKAGLHSLVLPPLFICRGNFIVFFFLFKGLTVIHGLGPTFILLWLLLSAGWRPRSVPLPATWWGLHPGLSWPGILRFVLHRQATCLGSEIPEDPPEWGGGLWGGRTWWRHAEGPGSWKLSSSWETCVCDAHRPRDQSLAFPPAVFRAPLLSHLRQGWLSTEPSSV